MKKNKIFLAILVVFIFVAPLAAYADTFSLVPCGGPGQDPCTFDDLIKLGIRLVNLLFSVAAIIAAYHIVMAGWGMMSSMGNSEKLTSAKQGLTHAVIGFAIVLLSFAFVNLLLGILGITCNWWEPGKLSCLLG